MSGQPTLETARLRLRPLAMADCPRVAELGGDYEIAHGTLTVPHPYKVEHAESWIANHAAWFEAGTAAVWGVCEREGGALVGTIGLSVQREHDRAELGYWIGKPYWGRGYATEAGIAVVGHSLGAMGLHRVYANHYVRNPASGKVLQKIGMSPEGCARGHLKRFGVHEDSQMYGALAGEWVAPPCVDAANNRR